MQVVVEDILLMDGIDENNFPYSFFSLFSAFKGEIDPKTIIDIKTKFNEFPLVVDHLKIQRYLQLIQLH